MDFTTNTDAFAINAAYISIAVNSKPLLYGLDTVMCPCFCTLFRGRVFSKGSFDPACMLCL